MMMCWQVAMLIFCLLQTKIDISFPYNKVMDDLNQIWDKETNSSPFKYVACDYAIPSHIYNKKKPTAILDTYEHKNPWVNSQDIANSGILILCSDKENTIETSNRLAREYDTKNNFKIQKYTYTISNILNKSDEYNIYYAIIKPKSQLN